MSSPHDLDTVPNISTPTLWHITISPYSEKVRWALAYKGVSYQRRAPVPGAHMAVALWLTRGRSYTFPILQWDGRCYQDSTAIIAALEDGHQSPSLYPDDPGERARALELEDFFDEQVGPYVRRFVFHELIRDPQQFETVMSKAAPGLGMGPTGVRAARGMLGLRYDAHREAAAADARTRVLAGLDKLESELGDADYLAGGRFSVADLTAAALFYPLVLPPEATVVLDGMPEPVERLRAELRERRGYRWVEQMFRWHRRPIAAAAG
ncbi:MAG: glutathione S-transferase family protein [Solirubrobacterales bacterium]|nr:glutathione S-transferase family protein [Solirubrobacterales bacterium]